MTMEPAREEVEALLSMYSTAIRVAVWALVMTLCILFVFLGLML